MAITGGPDPYVVAPPPPRNMFDARAYTYNLTPGAQAPAPNAPPVAVPKTSGPEPAPTTNPVDPGAKAVQIKNTISGKAIWDVMKNLPDAYKYAMFNALQGMGANQNDLQATVQHEMFGGDMNAMNQWKNYWGHTNANAVPMFDANTGRFKWIDTGFNLNDAQYTRHLNEFATGTEGTGAWMEKGLNDFGIQWDPNNMAKIGAAPWYSWVGAPPGQQEQFSATPVGTSPYTGPWGDPTKGAASFVGPVGGAYLQPKPLGTSAATPGALPNQQQQIKAPGVPVPGQSMTPIQRETPPPTTVTPTPTVPTPRVNSGANGYSIPNLRQRGWLQAS